MSITEGVLFGILLCQGATIIVLIGKHYYLQKAVAGLFKLVEELDDQVNSTIDNLCTGLQDKEAKAEAAKNVRSAWGTPSEIAAHRVLSQDDARNRPSGI